MISYSPHLFQLLMLQEPGVSIITAMTNTESFTAGIIGARVNRDVLFNFYF